MSIEWWVFFIWFNKLVFYLSTTAVVGGVWMLYFLRQIAPMAKILQAYIQSAAFAGAISSLLLFFLQVGLLADDGIVGMFDPLLMRLVWSTLAAKVQLFTVLCFGFLLVSHHFGRKMLLTQLPFKRLISSALFSLLIIFSYSKLGHSAQLSWWVQAILVLHILAVSLWMGALFPLWKLTQLSASSELKMSAEHFGKIAVYIVAGLVFCGVALLYLLLKNWETLINSLYGNVLLMKLALVLLLLGMAGINTLFLTPQLQQESIRVKLRWAIILEMCLGLSILMITAYLTTVIGTA